MQDQRDNLYATPQENGERFSFNDAVARVFPDMIKRSVPGYADSIAMIGLAASEFAQDDTYCYDLGCSLGASALAIRRGARDRMCTIVGIDNSEAMLRQCEHYVSIDNEAVPIELRQADVCEETYDKASFMTLNYTLQFIPIEKRSALLARCYQALVPGGALIISEKVVDEDADTEAQLQKLHRAFKRSQGYSDLEISQKRSALEQVLVPETEQTHHQRLRACGFSSVSTWLRHLNFISLIAVK